MGLVDLFFLSFLIFFVYLVYWSVKNDGLPLDEQTGFFRLKDSTTKRPRPPDPPRGQGPR